MLQKDSRGIDGTPQIVDWLKRIADRQQLPPKVVDFLHREFVKPAGEFDFHQLTSFAILVRNVQGLPASVRKELLAWSERHVDEFATIGDFAEAVGRLASVAHIGDEPVARFAARLAPEIRFALHPRQTGDRGQTLITSDDFKQGVALGKIGQRQELPRPVVEKLARFAVARRGIPEFQQVLLGLAHQEGFSGGPSQIRNRLAANRSNAHGRALDIELVSAYAQGLLTEDLNVRGLRILLMLDEFPALGRLDFFESALAFMAGYGLKSFLIAQSLNQIEKAYGPNNAILDNCHVRVAFATNDERTARRISDALGTATELRAMKNYAGSRLSPWLGHLMVSRQETARPLLTPGEVMQLPPTDELVLVSGIPPIHAHKARYYEDARLKSRILPPPALTTTSAGPFGDRPAAHADDWTTLSLPELGAAAAGGSVAGSLADEDSANGGIRREPALPEHEAIASEEPRPSPEFAVLEDEPDDDAIRAKALNQNFRGLARQAALDPDDGLGL